jgi:peptidoglycan/xylan/chitin deacetylase (PgdA/CDA1 family)
VTAPSGASSGPAAGVWRGWQMGKHLTANLMRALPMRLYGRLLPRRAVGLCYHVVSDRSLPHVRNLYRYKTPAQFEADLLYLKRHFTLVSYERLRSGSAPPNAAIVTFDDGLAECFTTARPLLLRHGVPCIFFVSPPHVDNRRMFSFDKASLTIDRLQGMEETEARRVLSDAGGWVGRTFSDLPDFARWLTSRIRTLDRQGERVLDRIAARAGVDAEAYLAEHRPYLSREQARSLAEDGFTIGAHGLRHVALGAYSEDEIRHEILESCRQVAELTGAGEVPFAFPFDADGVDRRLLARLRSDYPEVGLLFDTRQLRIDREFMVNRMIVDVPALIGGVRSNLGGYLRNAYLEELLRTGTRSPEQEPFTPSRREPSEGGRAPVG